MMTVVHTDGSCWPNPGGPGGWACVIESGGKRTELSGRHPGPTTNNRMEIQAAIEALRFLPEGSKVQIITDSQYLRNGGSVWIRQWKKRKWLTKEKTPVKNFDLWTELDRVASRHTVTWTWMRSHQHQGNENDRCDTLANDRRNGQGCGCKHKTDPLAKLLLEQDADEINHTKNQ